jgi:hypothetical protein
LKENWLQEQLQNVARPLAPCGARACVTGLKVRYLEPLHAGAYPYICFFANSLQEARQNRRVEGDVLF